MNIIQNVEQILSQYKQLLADYDQAVTEVLKLQHQKRLHQAGEMENAHEVVCGMSLAAPVLSHIPKSVTNKFSSVTENVALNYLQFLRPSKIEAEEIQKIIDAKCKIVTYCYEQIQLVEHMLNQLNEHERYIVIKIYFDKYGLEKTRSMFNKEYPEFYFGSEKSLRRKKFEALQKMSTRLKN